jgi:hypothetical protein
MERTARRFLDSIVREKVLSQDMHVGVSEEQLRGLAPLHLISLGNRS